MLNDCNNNEAYVILRAVYCHPKSSADPIQDTDHLLIPFYAFLSSDLQVLLQQRERKRSRNRSYPSKLRVHNSRDLEELEKEEEGVK